jgi:hypothetical protein
MDLQADHAKLLCTFVEATRNSPTKEVFMALHPCSGETLGSVMHGGLPDRHISVYYGDVEELADLGLLSVRHMGQYQFNFDVSTYGLDVYEEIRAQTDEPAGALEEQMVTYLESADFDTRNPGAYGKWLEAEKALWSKKGSSRSTEIGHLCREAMQEFASGLVQRLQIEADPNRAHVIARMRAVLESLRADLGKSTSAFLESLLTFWGCVNDLVQRQEHGAAEEHENLYWEDARRVVFQTLVVMYEIDRACTTLRP